MSEPGVRCGNCGVVNAFAAQFCVSCGVLLAAYQSPSGARPTDAQQTEPIAGDTAPLTARPEQTTSPEDNPANTPLAVSPPQESDDKSTPGSADDIFASLGEIAPRDDTDRNAPAVEALTIDAAVELPPPVPSPVEDTAMSEATQPTEPSADSEREAQPKDEAKLPDMSPVDAEWRRVDEPEQATAAQSRLPAPTITLTPQRRGASDRSRGSFGTSGQRVSSTPPQTLVVIGAALILGSCVLGPIAWAIDVPLVFEVPTWCAFPVGVIVMMIGLIQLASRRPHRL